MGLKIDVLSAYTDEYSQFTNNLANEGSLLFKVMGKEQSMLFCSDLGDGVSDILIGKWGETLKADYIQMGHHGNAGLTEAFYRLSDPEKAFFDAPGWLMSDDGQQYDTRKQIALMKELGADIYSFSTAPNRVMLK